MADPKAIHEFTTGAADNGSLFLVDTPDQQSQSGYTTEKLPMTDIGSKVVNGIQYTQDLDTEDKTVSGAINELHDSIGADVYNTNTSYTAGMYCIYNNTLYRCKENTSGAWDSTKWEAKTITSLLESKADKTSLPDLAIISANFTSALTANSSVVFDYEFTLPSGYKIISCFDNSYYANVQASVIRINSTTGHVFFNYIATVNVSSRTWEAKAVIAKNVN